MKRGAAIILALVAAACAPSDPLPGYRLASAEEGAAVIAVIDDYYALLSRAEVTGDASALLARHPSLASGQQRQRGINIETWMVERTGALKLREVRIDVASYEPVRIYIKDAAAAAYVHGLFTWEYAQGGSPTRGELAVRIDLIQTPSGWNIERTDEWVLGETPPPSPRR